MKWILASEKLPKRLSDKIFRQISSGTVLSLSMTKDWIENGEFNDIEWLDESPQQEDGDRLLQGFVNAYEVLKYNINPDLIYRTQKYLEQQKLKSKSPQQATSVEGGEEGKILKLLLSGYHVHDSKNQYIYDYCDLEKVAKEIAKLQLPMSRTDAVEEIEGWNDIANQLHSEKRLHEINIQAWKSWERANGELHGTGGVNPAPYVTGYKQALMDVDQEKINSLLPAPEAGDSSDIKK